MDKLTVTTDAARRRKNDLISLGVIFAILSAVLAYSFRANISALIAVELIMLGAFGWTYYRSCKNGNVTLSFNGNTLDIAYSDGRKYNIKDVDNSFFSLTQTAKDKAADQGTLSVASTNFRIMYVQSFGEVQQYISTHFPKEKKSIYYLDDEDED